MSEKQSPRLGEAVIVSNGRAPGFSAILEYLPKEDLAVIVLTNIEHDANPIIVPEAVAMVMGKTYKPFDYAPVPAAVAGRPAGDFVFGADFYRASATLNLATDATGTTLYWPGRARGSAASPRQGQIHGPLLLEPRQRRARPGRQSGRAGFQRIPGNATIRLARPSGLKSNSIEWQDGRRTDIPTLPHKSKKSGRFA